MIFSRLFAALLALSFCISLPCEAWGASAGIFDLPSVSVAARKRRRKRKRRRRKAKVAPVAPEVKAVPEPQPKPEPEPVPPPPVEKPGVAVLDMEAIEGVSAGVARILNSLMLERISKSGAFSSILGMSDIREMMDMEAQKSALGCDREGCLAEIGGALGVPLMIVPGLGKLGHEYVMTFKITDVETAKVKVRQTIIVPDEPGMSQGMAWLIDAALASLAGDKVPPEPTIERTVPLVEAHGNSTFRLIGRGGLALAMVGIGYASYVQLGVVGPATTRFDDAPTPTNYDQANAAIAVGNQGLAVGVGLAAAGAGLWWVLGR
jgi:hypothetical protein